MNRAISLRQQRDDAGREAARTALKDSYGNWECEAARAGAAVVGNLRLCFCGNSLASQRTLYRAICYTSLLA